MNEEKTAAQTASGGLKDCPHGESCVRTGLCGDRKLCTVEHTCGEHFLFLRESGFVNCPFRVPFGFGQICTCPVHYRLHASYRKKQSYVSNNIAGERVNL